MMSLTNLLILVNLMSPVNLNSLLNLTNPVNLTSPVNLMSLFKLFKQDQPNSYWLDNKCHRSPTHHNQPTTTPRDENNKCVLYLC